MKLIEKEKQFQEKLLAVGFFETENLQAKFRRAAAQEGEQVV